MHLFIFTLVTGPRRSLSLKLSDTQVYEPQRRARLGNHNTTILGFCRNSERDWYFIAKQPAPTPHLAHPEGCAALCIVIVTVPRVSRSCELCPDGGSGTSPLSASPGYEPPPTTLGVMSPPTTLSDSPHLVTLHIWRLSTFGKSPYLATLHIWRLSHLAAETAPIRASPRLDTHAAFQIKFAFRRGGAWKVDVRLPGKRNSNSHGARPVFQTQIQNSHGARTLSPEWEGGRNITAVSFAYFKGYFCTAMCSGSEAGSY